MQYTHPRFQTMGSNYQSQSGGFSGGPQTSSGPEQVTNPRFSRQWIPNLQTGEQVTPRGFSQPSASRMVHPRFQQGWSRETYAPNVERFPVDAPGFAPEYEGVGPQATPQFAASPQVAPNLEAPTTGRQTWAPQTSWSARQTGTPARSWSDEQTVGAGTGISTPGYTTQGFRAGQLGREETFVRQPAVDLFDEGENLIFEIELPGVTKDEVELVCDGNSLSLKAIAESKHAEENLVLSERGDVEYQRYIPVEVQIVPGEIEATFEDGVLTVTAPKKEPTSGLHQVQID